MREKSVSEILISRITGFLVFLILLALMSFLTKYIPNEIYIGFVNFLVTNLLLSIVILFLGILAEIFWNFEMPFDLFGPILSAVSSIFIVTYIYKLWQFIENYTQTGISIPINQIYPIVFWIVLAVGFIRLILRYKKDHEERRERKKKKNSEDIDWEDVGDQFKTAFYNIGEAFRKSTETKKKNKSHK